MKGVGILIVFLAEGLAFPQEAASDRPYETVIQPFFTRNCAKCHGDKKQKGDIRLDTLTPEFQKTQVASRWDDVMRMLSSGKLPPEGETRPQPAESAHIVEWIAGRLKEGES